MASLQQILATLAVKKLATDRSATKNNILWRKSCFSQKGVVAKNKPIHQLELVARPPQQTLTCQLVGQKH